MKKLFLIFPAVALITACSSPEQNSANPNVRYADPYNQVAGDRPTYEEYMSRFQRSTQVEMSGSMITAGELDQGDTTGLLTIVDGALNFRADIYTDSGWAMLASWGTLPENMEDGMVITLDENSIGCSGPQPGEFDFDGESEENMEIEVVKTDAGVEYLISADFGEFGQMTGIILMDEG